LSWGNDRETMTFDPACSHYSGPWLTVSTSGRNFTTPTVNGSHLAGDHFFLNQAHGAEVMVVNGSGAYQSRRLMDWGHTQSGGLWWLLDSAFKNEPGAGSFLEITCTHTHIIFERNRHEDVGVFQLYDVGTDVVAYGLSVARQDGIKASGTPYPYAGRTPSGWSMQANLRSQFIGIDVRAGLRAQHSDLSLGWNAHKKEWGPVFPSDMGENYRGWHGGGPFSVGWGKEIGFSFGVAPMGHSPWGETTAAETLPISNALITFRRNRVASNGGFIVYAGADILLEDNLVADTPLSTMFNPKLTGRGKKGLPWQPTPPNPGDGWLSAAPFLVFNHSKNVVLRGNQVV